MINDDSQNKYNGNCTEPVYQYVARAGVRGSILSMLDKAIIRGDLPGNGTDKTAERNGLIHAYNMVFDMG